MIRGGAMQDPEDTRKQREDKERVKVVDRRAFTPDGQRRSPDPSQPAPTAASDPAIQGDGFEFRPAGQPSPGEPPPSVQFNAFVVSLASTAFIHLGEMADPVTGRSELSMDGARQMIDILKRQHFNDAIPAGLPPGTPVAHKTGEITKIHHDAAIVLAPKPFILVVLVRGLEDLKQSAALIAGIARFLYDEAEAAPEAPRR